MTPQRPTLRAVTGAPETAAERAARQSAEARASASDAFHEALADTARAAAALRDLKNLHLIPEAIRHQTDLWAADCEVRAARVNDMARKAAL